MLTYTTAQFAPVISVGKTWKGTLRKSIIVVSLSKKGTSVPGSSESYPHVDYKVVMLSSMKVNVL